MNHKHAIRRAIHPSTKFYRRLSVLAMMVALGLVFSASQALAATLIWTNQTGNFGDPFNWSTGTAPAGGDSTSFTNNTDYTVTFTASTSQMHSNNFNGRAGTVTLDIDPSSSGYIWTITNQQSGAGAGAFVVGQGANTTASVLMVSGSLNALGISGAANIKIGGNGRGTFSVTNGTVRNETTIVGDTANGVGKLVLSGSSTLWTNGGQASTFNMGSVSANNSLIISNGAKLVVNSATIGVNATSSTNSVLIVGANSTLICGTSLTVGNKGIGNSLTVSNSGSLVTTACSIGTDAATLTTVLLSDAGTVWTNGGINVGAKNTARSSLLIVSNGAAFLSGQGTIGPASTAHTGIVVGAGSKWISTAGIIVGTSSSGSTNNNLTVYDGGMVSSAGSINIGNNVGSANTFNMGGAGAVSTGTALYVVVPGNAVATYCSVTVTNAILSMGTLTFNGSSNTVLTVLTNGVLNANTAVLNNPNVGGGITINAGVMTNGILTVGGTGPSHSLRVINGGKLLSNAGTVGGNNAAASNNVVLITDSGSIWSNSGTVTIGGGSNVNNSLTISNGATLLSQDLVVGKAGNQSNFLMIVDGKVAVSNLVVVTSNSVTFSSGTLEFSNLRVDGSLLGTAGVTVVSGATLQGIGSVAYPVTIANGGTFAPGDSVGTLTLGSNLVLNSTSILSYELGTNSDLATVAGDLTLDGEVNVGNAGGLASGDYTLITYDGTLANNTLTVGTLPAGFSGTVSNDLVLKRVVLALTGTPPTASFTGAPTSGAPPLQVVFTDTSTGTPTSWAWDFGDSQTSTGQNPTNTYAAAGTYTVQLIACNDAGCTTNTQVNYITATSGGVATWETAYGVTANDSDTDGDGMSNTNEFLAGFNPTNSAAYVHVLSETRSGNDLTITYLGADGDSTYAGGPSSRTNVLDFTVGTPPSYTNDFVSTGQTNVLSGGTGVGVVTSFVETNVVTGAARYYRVRVLVP